MDGWIEDLAAYAASGLRPVEGKISAQGLSADVEILTDRWGVPHVYADSEDDVYFAQGWLHATERLWQVEFTRRVAQGRLAEILGEPVLPLDRFFRTVGLERSANSFLSRTDELTARIADSYHRGFVEGARSSVKPVEYLFLDLEPSVPSSVEETIVGTSSIALLMAFLLSPNWEFELIRMWISQAVGPEKAAILAPFVGAESPMVTAPGPLFPSMVKQMFEVIAEAGKAPGIGSNNWVLDGSRTTTGKPLLCNDPHLKLNMPSIWMQMHLCCPSFQVTGVGIPGLPGISIGHNGTAAWGFTNTQADVADLYLERLSEDGTSYEFAGEWHEVSTITESIAVRHAPEPVEHEVKLTRHGPLLTSTVEGTIDIKVNEGSITAPLALKWIHHEIPISQRSLDGFSKARSFEEFREAARHWPIAGQNMVYADVDGHIGYQFTGTVPVRAPGVVTGGPLPGWTGEHEWVGVIDFDELPSVLDPESGYIATANNRIVGMDYPHHLTDDWEPPHRIRRIVALINEKERLSHEDMRSMQNDTYSPIAEGILPYLLSADPESGAAQKLRGWDGHLDAGSEAAAIFQIWVTNIADRLFADLLGDRLYDVYFRNRAWTTLWAFDAIRSIFENPAGWTDDLEELIASAAPEPEGKTWGQMHTVHFQHPIASAMPPLDELLSAGPYEVPGGDDTVNRGVFNPAEGYRDSATASYRQIIDLADLDSSVSVITTGNSGNPASPHYRDQAELWASGEYHPMPFSRDAVESASEGRLLLVPQS